MAIDDLRSDVRAALRGIPPGSVDLAVVRGTSFDRVAVVSPSARDPRQLAIALANLPIAAGGASPDEVWDRLAIGVRYAVERKNRSELVACAIAWRGRGRIVGPLDPDLLIRFGVSDWR